ncbi:hypothetical protein SAY87_023992 [Trapa incisa]|uniref:J domain-containing protein n=1 Tax=Trapa incisa TaxID=236973 RepID=A0AAN7L7D0_9MYRT|nr:hypothetical protein SAY87_023992 [Trapa incisa]
MEISKVGQIIPMAPRKTLILPAKMDSCKGAMGSVMSTKSNRVNFYDVLSLRSKDAGPHEIKRAYRSMALQFHPDVCPPSAKEESTRLFVQLQKAYETLSDPVSRQRHDLELGLCYSVTINHPGWPRKVWEVQLSKLRQISLLRMQKKKKNKGMMNNN